MVAGASLLLPATAGCTQSHGPALGAGQLRSVSDPASVCVPVGSDSLAVIGLDFIKNVGSGTVTVNSVSAVNGAGIEVEGASLVPDSDPAGFRGAASSGQQGHISNPVGQIAAGERVAVQATLRLTAAQKGTAHALRLSYTSGSGGATATADTQMTITLLPAGAMCDMAKDTAS